MTPKPGPKKERPKNRAQKMVTIFFHKGVKPDSLASPLRQKIGAQKTVIKK